MSNVTLAVLLRLTDQLSGPLRRIQGQIRGLGDAGQRLQLGGAAAMAGGAGALAAMRTPVNAFMEAEDAATQLKVAMMGAGGVVAAEYEQINALAGRLGNTLPGTTADFQQMMTMLVRQGVAAQTILGGTGEAAAKLGVMLKMPPQAAAEMAAKLQDATKTSAADMVSLADTIQRTFYLGVDPGNMLGAFSSLAPAMGAIKQEGLAGAQAMAPLIAMLDQAGLVGTSAGNALRKVFQGAFDADKVAKANKALAGKGVKLRFTDRKGEFAGMDNLFAQLAKLKGLSTSARLEALKELWGDDSETLQALNTMIDKGRNGYLEVAEKMRAQAGLQERVGEQLGTLKNLWDAATGTFTNALAAWAGAIAPELKALTTWFGELSEGIGAFVKENPAIARFAALFVGLGGAVGVVGGALAIAAGTILRFVSMFAAVASPIGLAVVAIGALAAAGVWLYQNWDQVAVWWGQLWEGIGSVVSMAWAGIQAGAASIWAGITQAVATAWAGIVSGATSIWASVTQSAAAAWASIQAGAVALLMGIQALWGQITSAASGAFEAVKSAASAAWAFVRDEALRVLMELPGKLLEAGKAAAAGLWAGIKSGAGAAWSAAKGLASGVAGGAKEELQVQSPSRVMMGIGSEVVAGLRLGIAQGSEGVLGQMGAMARGLAAPFAAGASQMGAMAQGLAAPFTAGASGLLGQMGAMAQGLAAPFSAGASGLLGQMGAMAGGAALNLSRGLAGPLAGATLGVGAMTAQAMPAPQPMLPALAGSPAAMAPAAPGGAPQVTLNLTVNGPANPDELSERIRRELDQWWRRAQADESLRRNGRGFD